jgi:hypothetical protein
VEPVTTDGLRRANRVSAAASLLVIVAVLTLARLLQPDPRGFGTHEHLFMPPCIFHTVTHLPCPFCGMTTGFAHMMRGEVAAAARSNPGAPLLFVVTCIGGLLSLRALIAGAPVLPAWVTGPRATKYALIALAALWAAHVAYVLFVNR